MNNEMDELQQLWNNAKQTAPTGIPTAPSILQAAAKRKSSIYFQYSNVVILAVVALVLWVFFYKLYPLRNTLSHIGSALMVGGLVLRISMEILSIIRAGKIHLTDSALHNTSTAVSYYSFRKTIHGPVTFLIVAAYSIGYYLLMPEWSQYFPLGIMLLLCCSYPVGAIIIIKLIRKGIRKEMEDLQELVTLQEDIKEEVGVGGASAER